MFQFIENGSITSVRGIKAAGINCGIKKQKKDLALIYSEVPCNTAGTFTLNKVVCLADIPIQHIEYHSKRNNQQKEKSKSNFS